MWLAQSTSEGRRGRVIGYSVSARSAGWILASLSSTCLATRVGLRPVFLLGGALLLMLIPVILLTDRAGATKT